MHPPHRPKRNESGEKSVSILVKTFFFFFFFLFGDHLNLGEKNVWISDFGRKISLNFGEDLFFFFFFWRPPEFGRKKRLNFRVRPKNHSQFWWRYPNFWGFVLQIPPPKFSGFATASIPCPSFYSMGGLMLIMLVVCFNLTVLQNCCNSSGSANDHLTRSWKLMGEWLSQWRSHRFASSFPCSLFIDTSQ